MLDLQMVMIGTEDAQPLVNFYTEVLGKPQWEDGAYTGWQAGSAGLMIGAHSEVKGRNASPGRMIINFTVPDVQAEFERIKSLGATIVAEPYQPGGMDESQDEFWLATIADPDGNLLQLASPMPDM